MQFDNVVANLRICLWHYNYCQNPYLEKDHFSWRTLFEQGESPSLGDWLAAKLAALQHVQRLLYSGVIQNEMQQFEALWHNCCAMKYPWLCNSITNLEGLETRFFRFIGYCMHINGKKRTKKKDKFVELIKSWTRCSKISWYKKGILTLN